MKVLFLGPLPEPVTGQSLACEVFLNALRQHHLVDIVNLSKRGLAHGLDSFSRLREVASILGSVLRRHKSADAIYFTISESIAGNLKDLAVYVLCWNKLRTTIVHLHGGEGMRRIMSRAHPVLRKANSFFLRRLGGVVVLGPRHTDMYREAVSPDRLHVVPNFAEDYLFTTPAEVAIRFGSTSPLRLLFLSNLLPEKGYLELLDAYLSLDNEVRATVRLDFAGTFQTPQLEEDFRARAASDPGVRILGSVRGAAKRALFHQAHVFCLPTYYRYEGQPISVLEAYASGCAVITTDHSGIRDIFAPGINGYEVDKGSVRSLRDGILRAISDPSALLRMGLNNLQMAMTTYRASTFAGRLLEVLASVQPASGNADDPTNVPNTGRRTQ